MNYDTTIIEGKGLTSLRVGYSKDVLLNWVKLHEHTILNTRSGTPNIEIIAFDNNITVAIDNEDQKIFRISFGNANYSWKGFKVSDVLSTLSKIENLFTYEDFDQVFFPLSYKGICFETYDKNFSIKDIQNLKIDLITVYDLALDEIDQQSMHWNDVIDILTGEILRNPNLK